MVSRISTLRSVGVLAHRGASWWATASPPNRIAPVPMRAMTGSFSSAIEQLLAVARGTPGSGGMDPKRTVPPHIPRPDYAEDGVPKGSVPKLPWKIPMNSAEDIACAREAGRISREVLDVAGRAVAVGVSTDAIDAIVHEETIKRGAYPSPLNYRNFPRSVCTSVNEVVCHGIPDENRIFVDGDLVNIDVSCYFKGFHGDNSEMFVAGEPDEDARRLIQVTYDAWRAAIAICRPGVPYSKIGGVIQEYVETRGMSTTRNYCGHGVGRVFHTTPSIVHYHSIQNHGTMAPGHIFTIEPMINLGGHANRVLEDDWTVVTFDGSRSAQFEHTILITETGYELLTGKSKNCIRQFWESED